MTDRRLVLLRHAKAEQGARDRDRALTARGRADATAAGAWLVGIDAVPDLVLVSPARRTVQTWEAVSENLGDVPDVRYDDRIYDNSVEDLLAAVRDVDEAVRTALLIGHNPSTHALAARLAGDAVARRELGEFPTATAAVFALDGEWVDVGDHAARLLAVKTCRSSAH
jgi:phosphohistidine phosphatase